MSQLQLSLSDGVDHGHTSPGRNSEHKHPDSDSEAKCSHAACAIDSLVVVSRLRCHHFRRPRRVYHNRTLFVYSSCFLAGTFGCVYRAPDKETGQQVAVKVRLLFGLLNAVLHCCASLTVLLCCGNFRLRVLPQPLKHETAYRHRSRRWTPTNSVC